MTDKEIEEEKYVESLVARLEEEYGTDWWEQEQLLRQAMYTRLMRRYPVESMHQESDLNLKD